MSVFPDYEVDESLFCPKCEGRQVLRCEVLNVVWWCANCGVFIEGE